MMASVPSSPGIGSCHLISIIKSDAWRVATTAALRTHRGRSYLSAGIALITTTPLRFGRSFGPATHDQDYG